MNRELILVIFAILIIIGCEDTKVFKKPDSAKNVIISELSVDTIHLTGGHYSYVGFSETLKTGEVFLIDQKFGQILQYDTTGHYIKKVLSRGKGPYEYSGGDIYGFWKNNETYNIIDQSVVIYTFGHQWNKKSIQQIYWGEQVNEKELLQSPGPDMKGLYYPDFSKFIVRSASQKLFFNLNCDHPEYNITSNDYVKEAHIIGEVNLGNLSFSNLLGHVVPYHQNNSHPQFWVHLFDITRDGSFYVNSEPDSVIYKFDPGLKNTHAFGNAGKQMDNNYMTIQTFSELGKYHYKERNTKSYYTWLEYIDEIGLLFRSYKKSKDTEFDGLQIYRNDTLIGDVKVPRGFKVDNYLHPYIYSHVQIDEMAEKMQILRFKVQEKWYE